MSNIIYMDNNATTQPLLEAIEAFNSVPWANPHQTYKAGLLAHNKFEEAKKIIAKCINCLPEEVYFTSSATEACNWAIQILVDKQCKLIYKEYEHSAVMKPIYAKYNPEAEHVQNGYVQMLVQNIYGEIFSVPQRENPNDLIFMDGTAAVGHMPIDFQAMNIDMLAFGAHKFNGLRGCGCLIIRKSVLPVKSLIWGGDVTGGTPVPGLVYAMAIALQWNCEHMEDNIKHITTMRNYMIKELSQIPYSHLNGPTPESGARAANNINFSFYYINGADIMKECNDYNIYISTGSACAADDYIENSGGICIRPRREGKKIPEVVTIFEAGGLDSDIASNAVRITLGFNNTMDECKYVVNTIKDIIEFNRPL